MEIIGQQPLPHCLGFCFICVYAEGFDVIVAFRTALGVLQKALQRRKQYGTSGWTYSILNLTWLSRQEMARHLVPLTIVKKEHRMYDNDYIKTLEYVLFFNLPIFLKKILYSFTTPALHHDFLLQILGKKLSRKTGKHITDGDVHW